MHRFDIKRSKMLRYVAKHSKLRKTTKVIKLQWIASIWCQKDQINGKLQKWSYFDEFGLIWRQNDQNVWVRSQHYKINQITMDCIDLTSKQSKMLRYVAKHSKLRKTTKVIKLQWIASIWCEKDQTNAKLQKWSYFNELGSIWPQNDQKRWGTSQNIENNGKLQNWSITMNCIDLRSKRSENPKLQTQSNNKQFASIWHQNDQNCWVTS